MHIHLIDSFRRELISALILHTFLAPSLNEKKYNKNNYENNWVRFVKTGRTSGGYVSCVVEKHTKNQRKN